MNKERKRTHVYTAEIAIYAFGYACIVTLHMDITQSIARSTHIRLTQQMVAFQWKVKCMCVCVCDGICAYRIAVYWRSLGNSNRNEMRTVANVHSLYPNGVRSA